MEKEGQLTGIRIAGFPVSFGAETGISGFPEAFRDKKGTFENIESKGIIRYNCIRCFFADAFPLTGTDIDSYQ